MSRPEGIRRIVRRLGLGAGALLVATSPLWASHVGRRIPWLEVDRIEIAGTVLLAPHEVLIASGVRPGMHLLDDRAPLLEALLAHPVIEDVTISRQPPGTLVIRIREKHPVALVDDGTLRPATAAGEILPIDPSRVAVDLPIVHGTLADSAGAAAVRATLAEVERLTLLDPSLMAGISEIRPVTGQPDVFRIAHAEADFIVPVGADAARIAQLKAALEDAVARSAGDSRQAGSRLLLDLRFGEQIVVGPLSILESF